MNCSDAPVSVSMTPVAVFRGGAARKYEAPRQGVHGGAPGVIEFRAGGNFEQALRDLDGFERIWVLFVFDRNGGAWRTTTRPPVDAPGRRRVGVFASRSPYRPNPIGLSCVRLLSVKGRVLEVAETDLLDGTPVLDVKPYLPESDAFPDAAAGWTAGRDAAVFKISETPGFASAARRVLALGGPDLAATARIQLGRAPFDSSRKRVARTGADGGTLSLRMFRIDFTLDPAARAVTLRAVRSGYSAEELASTADPYADKALHRAFAAARDA